MKDKVLLKIALIWGLFGLFLLIIVAEFTEPEPVKIREIEDKVGNTVIVEGNVTKATYTATVNIFDIVDETENIKVVVFDEMNKSVSKGDLVRVTGEVDIHKGELEIKADKIDCISC